MRKRIRGNENKYYFVLDNGDVIYLEQFEYNDEEMTPNCVTINLIRKKDWDENFSGFDYPLNKMPVWEDGKPIIISVNLEIK